MDNESITKQKMSLHTKKSWLALALLGLGFLVLKSFSLHWQIGDENIYLYMSWAVLDHGALPYRDFFFAHPPMHLFPGPVVFGLFGFSPSSARLLPVGASLVSAFFLFVLLRKKTGHAEALCAVASFLFAFSVLRASSHWTGVNLTVMWITIGLYVLLNQRFGWAGIWLALSVTTANYALPGAVMCALLAFLHDKRSGKRYLLGFFSVWFAIGLFGLVLGGMSYIDAVYRYHFLKSSQPSASTNMFFRVLTDNYWLHLSTLITVGLVLLDRKVPIVWQHAKPLHKRIWLMLRSVLWQSDERSIAVLGFLWALGYLMFIFLLPRVYPFYFLPVFVGMALCVAYLAAFVRARIVPIAPVSLRRYRQIGIVALIFVVAYCGRVWLQRSLLPNYTRSGPVAMKWSDSPLPVNSLFRWCCWDDVAQANTAYGTIQEYLYHEARYFQIAPQLAERVADLEPQQTLFGDSSSAGLVALLSGRALAQDFADTNRVRFASGITDPQEAIDRVTKGDLGAVLVRARPKTRGDIQVGYHLQYFASLPEFSNWLQREYVITHRLVDRTKGTFLILVPTGVR